jgi:hypothetical protein
VQRRRSIACCFSCGVRAASSARTAIDVRAVGEPASASWSSISRPDCCCPASLASSIDSASFTLAPVLP